MDRPQVLVVGAGPTGLVLALWLARSGVPVRIIDGKRGPGAASRAIGVQARTLELYAQLGIADDVVSQGIPIETLHLRGGGREVARVRFKDIGKGISPFPFMLSYPQDDHERLLVDKLRAAGVAVDWGVRLTSFSQRDGRVRVRLDRDGVEEVCDVSYLCGCDGAHSRVRQGLALDFAGGTYDQLFYVSDVKIAGDFEEDLVANFTTRDFGLMLPVRSSGMERIIGVVPTELASREDLGFEDVRPFAEAVVGVRVERVNWFSTYRVHHRVAAHFRAGRAFLAGDAAHVHSPVGGQGMNTGIGDAVNLSWKLAAVLQGRAAPSLLDTYEPERISFARALVKTTDWLFQKIVGQKSTSGLFRAWLLPRVVSLLTGGSKTARRAVFRLISQVRINYRGSDISDGKVRRIRGGDRLPWVKSNGTDNFGPLRSLDWQVHVYGNTTGSFRSVVKSLGLELRAFSWNDAARDAGLQRDACYLVRPDGYVALALAHQDGSRVRAFASERGLFFHHPRHP